jgi:hypothetical protein
MSSTQTTKMNQVTPKTKAVTKKTKTKTKTKPKTIPFNGYKFDHEDSDPDVQRNYMYKSTRTPCYYDDDSEPEDPP